ncbi:MAG: hypothetical protein AAB549_02155, partial [Patescibacteria group bacterium]
VLKRRAKAAGMSLAFVESSRVAMHQKRNEQLAIAVGRMLHLTQRAIDCGLQNTRLAARIERIAPNVIVDGSHNFDKLTALARMIRMLDYKRVHVIFGIGSKKDITKSLRPLTKIANRWTLTKANVAYPVPMPPKRIAHVLSSIQPNARITIQPNAERALTAALHTQRPGELLLITGSFYLAGELRQHWIPERSILTHRTLFP